jgi:galactose-1-phosphate uridylyltransferase
MEFSKELHNGVEYRFDPLTNHQTRINPARAERILQSASAIVDTKEWVQHGIEKCPFCPERICEATPCFPSDFCEEGRMQDGETYIFPNLNPFSQYHAVATLSPRHFLEVDQFDETLLSRNLKLSRDYFLAVNQHDRQARYPIYLWNYLPPSAGSIIHPHVQLMIEQSPIPEQETILEKSKQYFEDEGANFWDDLIAAEQKVNERYIGEVKNIHLLASYAPRGFREVTLILSGLSSFVELDSSRIKGLARCISTILKGYKSMGVGSFNLVSFSSGVAEKLSSFTLHFKIISRPYPRGIYTNDAGPFERLYDVWVIDTLPEMVAQTLKKFF